MLPALHPAVRDRLSVPAQSKLAVPALAATGASVAGSRRASAPKTFAPPPPPQHSSTIHELLVSVRIPSARSSDEAPSTSKSSKSPKTVGKHTEYRVDVSVDGASWTVWHRYSDFRSLHATLSFPKVNSIYIVSSRLRMTPLPFGCFVMVACPFTAWAEPSGTKLPLTTRLKCKPPCIVYCL